MNIVLFSMIGVSVGVIIWQLAVLVGEIQDKDSKYEGALASARKAGKPLLVAGGPWSDRGIRRWLKMPAHGAGDVCIDIELRAFDGHPYGLIADITRIPFSDKAFGAVFASHILEHMPSVYHANMALDELERVAETVFLAYPSRQSIGAWLHPGHCLWVWQKGSTVYVEPRNNSADKKSATHHAIGTIKHVLH